MVVFPFGGNTEVAAMVMAKGVCGDYVVRNPIAHLNGLTAICLDLPQRADLSDGGTTCSANDSIADIQVLLSRVRRPTFVALHGT